MATRARIAEREVEPADGCTVTLNPPPFAWRPVPDAETYCLEVSSRPDFREDDDLLRIEQINLTVCSLPVELAPGRWFWRVAAVKGARAEAGPARRFDVPADAPSFPLPRLTKIFSRIPAGRPRLLFGGDPEQIRARAREAMPRHLGVVCQKASAAIGQVLSPEPSPLPPANTGRAYAEILRATRPGMDAMQACGLAYLLTGERRYAAEVKRLLLHYCAWDTEGATCVYHNDEPAMWMMMRGCRAYDWASDELSEAERRLVARVFRRRAEQFYFFLRRMHFEFRPYDSHAARMLGFLGEASIAFFHEWPEAWRWLAYVTRIFWATFPAWGKDDGAWSEGPHYWEHYMGFALHFALALRRATGLDLLRKPFFRATPYYYLYTHPPYAVHSPFGDGQSSVGAWEYDVAWAFARLAGDPYLKWACDSKSVSPPATVFGFVLGDNGLRARPPVALPQGRAFAETGLASLHTALGDPHEDVSFLMRSSPFGSTSHAHADQNAFTVEAFGEALAIASGHYPWYDSPHHLHWTCETRAANSITHDGGRGQDKRSWDAKGAILSFVNGEEFDYVLGDASAAYGGRLTLFKRHVVHLRPGVFVMLDELDAPQPRRYEWLLHAFKPMRCEPGAQRVTSSSGDARLDVTFLAPGGLVFEQTDQFTVAVEHDAPFHVPRDPAAGAQWHFKASLPVARRAQRFLTVLHARRAGEPRLTPVLAADGHGVELLAGGRLHKVLFRAGEGEDLRAGGLSTDGHLLAVRLGGDGRAVSFLAAGARRVGRGREQLLQSDEPTDCAVTLDDSGGAVALGATAATVHLRLFGAGEVSAVKGEADLYGADGLISVRPSRLPRAFEFLRRGLPHDAPETVVLKVGGARVVLRAERLDRRRWVAYFEPRVTTRIAGVPGGIKIAGATVRREAGGVLSISPGSVAAVVGELPAPGELVLDGAGHDARPR